MTEQEWFNLVSNTLSTNPDWLTTTNAAITHGIKDRLAKEVAARASAEVSLVICYDAGKDKVPAHQIELVKNSIKNSKMFGGTEYAKSL
jgi:hypothetical protein